MSAGQRELHLNAFLMEAGHHEAAWRLPESNPRADFDLPQWVALALLAEEANQQWTARFNPRPVTEADILSLYRAAW